MIKGKTKEELTTSHEVIAATNGGYDIFAYYLNGKVARIMKRPWGKQERKMSWGIFPKMGVWFWKDHATEETGTAVHFVERYFNLSLAEAISKIKWDFGIGQGKEINVNPVKVTWAPPDEKDYIDIIFDTKPFTEKHHAFWNAAEVTEDHLQKYNCWAVKSLSINRKRAWIAPDEIVFAYYVPEEDACKIYFPEREKDKRFRNNVSYHHLWNYENLGECDHLIVQKSVKDMLVTTLIDPCCIATQAEAVKIFNEDVVNKINTITKKPWIWYGSDWDGVKKCKEVTDTNKWKYINTPKNLLPDINDAYGFVKKFGLKALEDFMRTKKLLK